MNSQSLRIIHLLYSFMQQNCPESCHKLTSRPPEVRHVPDDKEQFYDFKAKTSVGKVLEMENFEGYVTVIVNCARVCGEFIFGLRMDVFKAFVHAVDSMAGYCFHDKYNLYVLLYQSSQQLSSKQYQSQSLYS